MSRTAADSCRWAAAGTTVLLDVSAGLDDDAYAVASLLPGWTRRHVVAHLAANADALGNLVRWAATGAATPMYASPRARAEGIERGLGLPAADLSAYLHDSADALAAAWDRLDADHWGSEVVTAQGRTVPATEIPWLRAREVWVHAVDLRLGVTFADLPTDFLEALCADVVAKRGEVPDVAGPLPQRAAWLTGRPHRLEAPHLGAWL